MQLPAAPRRRQRDHTLAFINVVLLILVFLIMSGAGPGSGVGRIEPANAGYAELATPPGDAVRLDRDGAITWRGKVYDAASLADAVQDATGDDAVRIYADRDANAADAVRLVATLRHHGITDIAIVAAREAAR